MPFGRRNAGATYQQLVDKTFHGQISRNLKVYVDDLVIKIRMEDEVVRDIEETFKTLRKINMKLNPKKCTFGVEEGMFLGYQVNTKGIKICPEKVDAVLSLQSPKCLKDVHKLNGKLLPTLTAPEEQEELIVYLAASKEAVTALLMTEREARSDTQFETTNNEVEYEALIAGLRIEEKMGVKNLKVNVDSKLVANQVNGTYIAKETDMIKYLEQVKALTSTFRAFSIKHVLRSKNKKVDALSKMASTSFAHLSKHVLVEELKEKSVNEREVLTVVEEEGDTWMTPIHEYLTDETLPAETKKARAIKCKSQRFAIINGILYKKSFLGPWLRCVEPSQANYHFASVKHPQTNGLVERANRSLGEGIKARLGKDNKNWLEEISHVLWAHRTMIKSSNGDTPFSLTYGTEAVIPAEIGMPTFRTAEVDVAENDEALEINLELLEEKREQAAIREAKSKRQMEKYYNTKVRNASFKPGDLVYRSNEASRVEDTGKLGPKWEGPYEVTEALGKGSYKLKDCNGKELPRTWNVCNLKKCYIHKV
ncbi:reverse transcriptase domain-containing protein [Tanacetum coccineum]|uniref:Reverse transcriptase domain-containing protein n=1 Tax=Tanacetum coccineum TaxID=301880 RepID=A0ABQ5EEA8_9ASTR